MLKGSFYGGAKEIELDFTSNGTRGVEITIPKGTVVKRADMTVEVRDHPQQPLNRIGLVRNCPLPDFHAIEEALEKATRSHDSVLRGWGVPGTQPVEEKFAVIPIDPTEMLLATPSRYRTEYDMVIIPAGEGELKLDALVHSGTPIVTMNSEVAKSLGLIQDTTLHAGITTLRIVDRMSFITERVGKEFLSLGPEGKYVVVDTATQGKDCIVLADTGTQNQGVIISSLDRKYCYFGMLDAKDLVSELVFPTFVRAVEWCGVGGVGADVRIAVGPSSLDLGGKRSLRLKNFAQVVEEARKGSREEKIQIGISASSPCRVFLRDLDMELAYIAILNHFQGQKEVVAEFDSLSWFETKLSLPRDALVRYATMKVETSLLNERVANRCTDPAGEYGVMLSPGQYATQRIRPETAYLMKHVGFMLSRLEDETLIEVSLVAGGEEHPSREVLASEELEPGDLPVEYAWVDVQMESTLDPKNAYWFVLRPIKGKARWRCTQNPQGWLMHTKDGGRLWTKHMMDALHKVYVEAQSTTMPIMSLESVRVWSGKRAIESIDDLSAFMNDYLLKAPKGQPKVDVPIKMFTDVIGSARLFDLVVEYETQEEVEAEGAEVRSIVEMIESLKMRVDELARKLGPKAEELKVVKSGE
jgi:hypothetical protein